VTNLTPAYQGNNPVISYSAMDAGAGVSQKWQAVDVFVQEFDRDAASLKAPVYKGTYYPGNGITVDRVSEDGNTFFYSLKTNFDLKQGDHLRAVVYGGQGTDWYVDSNFNDLYYGTRQYQANGGVRDSINNAAGPVEVNTTIDFNRSNGPAVAVTSGTCLGANSVVTFTADAGAAAIDWNTLSITYTDVTNNKALGVHTYANVKVQGDVVTDANTFNLANGTHVHGVIHLADKGTPIGETNVQFDFTVDATAPVITLSAGAAQTDAKIALDVAGTDCSGNFDVDWNTVVVTVDGVTKSSEGDYTVDQNLRRITVNNPGYGKTLVVTVADKAGNIGRYSAVTQSSTLGFGSGSGAPHNYPNPFNNNSGSTTIALGLTKSANVEFKIFDLAGNLVKSWANVSATPATTLTWDGRDDQGRIVARGVYLGRIKATDGSHTAATIMKIAVAQ
jgi:hypothetical protein